ncbi:MAG: 5'/3'-nucleotidase SurE [Bacteroidales bacterium]|jgi:5'-nucleotidase|nr:5'/3'-nucleotidase SurE [Bacteroidales bacterium]
MNPKNKKKPLIVVTNDDGADSRGIKALIEVAVCFGKVVVVAPSKGRSGMGHAITLSSPLRIFKSFERGNVEVYRTNGTTADSVKLAIRHVLKGQKIDLLISGINQGANTSVSVIYSSTVSGAVEGCINGVPSVAFSIANYQRGIDFTTAKAVAKTVIEKVLQEGLPKNTCLNVNIPAVGLEEIKGFKSTRQAMNYWKEIFEERIDLVNHPYFWMGGNMVVKDRGRDTDVWAVEHDYISICPLHIDHTAHEMMAEIKKWKLKK